MQETLRSARRHLALESRFGPWVIDRTFPAGTCRSGNWGSIAGEPWVMPVGWEPSLYRALLEIDDPSEMATIVRMSGESRTL